MKPGWKTTEFWLTILTVLGMFCLAAFAMDTGNVDSAAIITSVGAALSAVGYSVSRAKTKMGQMDASLSREQDEE